MSKKTIIIRHRKENLKKCSLRGLEERDDLEFLRYPLKEVPDFEGYLLLEVGAPPLSENDRELGILLLDSTWRYAEKMEKTLAPSLPAVRRSLPDHFRTAYPRRQEDCSDPELGLASVEALFLAYHLTGRDVSGLLDHYHWAEDFLKKNNLSHLLK